MKKMLILIAVLACLVIISVRPVQYLGWKTIRAQGVGSFMVPAEWVYTVEDGLVCLTDRPVDEDGCRIYLAEPAIYSDGNDVFYMWNKLFGEAKHTSSYPICSLSNSSGYGIHSYEQNGNITSKFVIGFYAYREFTLIAWDNLVDEHTIRKIAESYVMED